MTNPARQLPLGVRSHSPARSCELMPGGRIRKNETLALPVVGWACFVPDMPDCRKLSRTFTLWRWAFWAGMLAVLVFSLMPQVPNLPTTGGDKSNQLLGFAVLAWLGCCAYPGCTVAMLPSLLAYGGLIGVLQFFTPYRFAEWVDLLADALGQVLGGRLARLSDSRLRTSNSTGANNKERGPRPREKS